MRSRSIFTGSCWRVKREPLRQTAHVRVDDNTLRIAELRSDDVRGLPRNSRQPHELLHRPRHLPVELLDQHPHRAPNRPRFLTEEPGGVDVALELLFGDGEVVLGSPVLLEERLRDAVDVHVRRLGGQHHGHEQLQVGSRPQRDRSVRMRGAEPLDHRPDPLPLGGDASPGFRDEATRQLPFAGGGPRRRRRAPDSPRKPIRSASARTCPSGCGQSRPTAPPPAEAGPRR